MARPASTSRPYSRRESSSARRYSSPQPASCDLFGHPGPEVRRQRLPLGREHPVTLEIAEGAVVGHDLEPVAQRLEPAPRTVAAVGPLADQIRQQRGALVGVQRRDGLADRLLGRRARLEQQRAQQVVLVAVDAQQRHRRSGVVAGRLGVAQSQPPRPALAGLGARLQVADPLAATVRTLHPGHEARHHRLDLLEDHPPVVAGLGQRVRQQVEDQLLVGLAGGEDAHVRERRGRQQPSQEIQRLGPDRPLMSRGGLAGCDRELLGRPRRHPWQRPRVDREQLIHRRAVLRSELGVAVVAVAARRVGDRRVVGDVARRLLEVGAQPRALQDLGEHVGDPLAGDVGAAELGDRVVAVAQEDPLVQLGGALALGWRPTGSRPARRRRTRRGTAAAASPGSASSAQTARP